MNIIIIIYSNNNNIYYYYYYYYYLNRIKILQKRINKLTEDNEILINNYNKLSNSYKKGIYYIIYI